MQDSSFHRHGMNFILKKNLNIPTWTNLTHDQNIGYWLVLLWSNTFVAVLFVVFCARLFPKTAHSINVPVSFEKGSLQFSISQT